MTNQSTLALVLALVSGLAMAPTFAMANDLKVDVNGDYITTTIEQSAERAIAHLSITGHDLRTEVHQIGDDTHLDVTISGSHQRNIIVPGFCPDGMTHAPVEVEQSDALNLISPRCI